MVAACDILKALTAQAAQLAWAVLACATRRCQRCQGQRCRCPFVRERLQPSGCQCTRLSHSSMPSTASQPALVPAASASASCSDPAMRHHGRHKPPRQRLGCCAGTTASTSCPGSGLRTLRARMHAQALLCGTTVTAGCPGSGAGTLRARMQALALLRATTAAASRPGSGLGTLRARMHAQTLSKAASHTRRG